MKNKVNIYHCPCCNEDFHFPFVEDPQPCDCDFCNTSMYSYDTEYVEYDERLDDIGFYLSVEDSFSTEETMPF